MLAAKVLPKGQITIPKKIREKLRIKDGDMVSLEEVGDMIVLRKGNTLFDIAGSIELNTNISIKKLIEKAREEIGIENI